MWDVVCRPFGSRRFVALTLALCSSAALISAQIPGRNVNMVSGDKWPGGDPFLQRQNEPSLAASTRNPLHLLAGANDYRTVDIPGLPDGGEIGDAWLGLFKSLDGGSRWKSTLLPGYPQDTSPEGKASPLYGYQAGADPVVRPGPSGLFYYSGIVFDRVENGRSRVFVSRFIDNNNKEAGDPIHYLGATAVASEPVGGGFIDKPWMAVDIPRGNSKTCAIDTPGPRGGRITQRIPAHNVYLAYAIIRGTGAAITSTLMFSRSVDCGVTFTKPIAISRPTDKVNQGAAVAVDPTTGSVYVAWRKFGLGLEPDGILVARTLNGQTFDKPSTLREFYSGRTLGQLIAFLKKQQSKKKPAVADEPAAADQAIAPFDTKTLADQFRTNAFPTMAIDAESRVYVAWSERGFRSGMANSQDASIVMSTGVNGTSWAPSYAVDLHGTPGHQFMPSLAFGGGKLMLVYYDLREDVSGFFNEWVDETVAIARGTGKRHTIDLRATQADPGSQPAFLPSVRVSEYVVGSRPRSKLIEQLQFNPPNLPLFQLGEVPFIGDYVDIAAAPAMVQDAKGQWHFNTAPSAAPVFHTAWTDNRDVRPPTDKDWKRYTPPIVGAGGEPSKIDPEQQVPICEPGRAGMRNQNIYTSRITAGLLVGSPGNSKPLHAEVPRGFVVFAQNATDKGKAFRLTIENQPVGGWASFTQLEMQPIVTHLDVAVPARSTVSRTVFATSTDPQAKINVDITQIESVATPVPVDKGLSADVVLNPDISNPDISNPDISNPDISNPDISNPDISNPDISNAEVYNPDISNPDISNPDISNPDISNPDISNPDISNVVVMNPDISNPDISNPDISNPDISNPDISNPDISNPDISNGSLTDVTWTVTNKGNTTASYDVNLFTAAAIPGRIKTQLIVHKAYTTQVSDGCTLKTQTQTVLVTNIVNPDISNPDISNASLWLEPGATGKITLRVLDPDPNNDVKFDPVSSDAITPEVQADAVNTEQLSEPAPEPPAVKPPTVSSTSILVAIQPSSALVGAPIGAAQVQVWRTVDGSPSPLANATVAVGLLTNPGGAQLAGTTSVATDANGFATFQGLSIDRPGVGYVLAFSASAAGALPVPSNAFDVTIPAADPTQNVFIVTTTADSGPGSLRKAILDANATPNFSPLLPDLIVFAFRTSGVQTIPVPSPLPALTQPVVIDGRTQAGYDPNTGQPVVQIAGTEASFPTGDTLANPQTFSAGFTIDTPGAVIRGLSVTGFGTTPIPNNTIAVRVISGFATIEGNWIGLAPDGSVAPNQVGIWVTGGAAAIGGTSGLVTRNVISGNRTAIAVNGGSGTVITGNYVGTDPTGTLARSNFIHGISLFGPALNVTIGGAIPPGGYFDSAWPGNLIAANLQNGIQLLQNNDGAPTNTQVLGNVVGLNINGDDISIGRHGILVSRAPGTVIGAPGAGNIIAGNGRINPLVTGNGITVSATPTAVSPVPVIQSNWIGVDVTGTLARANAYGGVVLESPAVVGGTGPGEGNLIAGNGDATIIPLAGTGVYIGPAAGGTVVQGNTIGLNVNGAALGNGYSGIGVHATALIGGDIVTTPLARNVISGNPFAGIAISAVNAVVPTDVIVRGNYIGTNASGVPGGVGNGAGISVTTGAGHWIGGDTAAEGNLIAGNNNSGVIVTNTGTQVAILTNRIFQNGGLGIDLGNNGLTLNDPGDTDEGPNRLLNYPELGSATRNTAAGTTVIPVSFTAAPGVNYRLQFFTNAACDGTNGEGADLLHQADVMPASGDASILINAPLVPVGTVVTATLTALTESITSEFSNCVTAEDGPAIIPVTTTADSGGGSLRDAITFANGSPNSAPGQPDVIVFAIPGAGARTIVLASPLPAISESVFIDGTTQPGYNASAGPLVHLAGSGANQFQGLVFQAGAASSTVRGLSLTGFGSASSTDTTAAVSINASSVSVLANWIGIAPDGNPLGNQTGVWITGGSGIIGGTSGAVTRNVIAAGRTGIFATAGAGTTIRGNFIGTAPDGVTSRSNTVAGISLQTNGVSNTLIGGPVPLAGYFAASSPANLISSNLGGGIVLQDTTAGGPTNTQILGNVIGLAADGSDLGNNSAGIRIRSASGTVIGAPGAGNVISGNGVIAPFTGGRGVIVQTGPSGAPAVMPVIRSNRIGTDLTGTAAVPNAFEGILLSAPATVGGLGSGWGNVIAGNGYEPGANGTGILVQSTAGGSVIQGNTIGLGLSGVALGNGYSGITIVGANGVTIGNGPNSNGRNIISGNPQRGIQIQPNGATQAANITVVGNWIGTDLAGNVGAVGNGDWGIVAEGTGIAIGGDGGGDGNRIVGNGFRQVPGTKGGIAVVGAASTVKIWSNRIHDNNGLGIDLGYDGITPNDLDDGDAGPNDRQNHPTLGARVNSFTGAGYLRVRLDSHPGVYRIEVFTNTACDASGRGEGQQLLIWSNRTVPAFGDLDDVLVFPASLLVPGQILTATATDAAGRTSEFSDCITVAATNAFYWNPVAGGNGHFYEYVNTPTASWNTANLAANSSSVLGRPGRLVTITSASENEFVRNLYLGMGLGDMRAWIGLRDLDGSNTWDWVTGEAFSYSNWNGGEPNNLTFEHWVEFHASGLWNNVSETFGPIQGYVIEYDLP